MDLKYLFISIVVLMSGSVISPFRWYYILKQLSINYSFWKVFKINYLTNLLGTITPGRIGEVVGKIGFLKIKGEQIDKSLTSVILNRIADLFFLLLLGSIGVLVFFQFLGVKVFFLVFTPLILIILFLILIRKNFSKNLLEKFFIFFIPLKFKLNWQMYFKKFLSNLEKFNLKNYLAIFLITSCSWIIIFISMYLLALSLGIYTIPFFYLVISVAFSRLVGLLPISIFGLGTREATLLALFSLFNIPPEKTIAFSLFMPLISVIFSSSIGVYAWFKEKF